MTRQSVASVAAAALATVGLGALAWGALVERNRFTVRREIVPILEPGSAPIKVLHLSDLHMAPWQRNKQDWVRNLRDLEPDLIVNTGDNLGHPDGIEGVQRALEVFQGIPGVFVNGSNDYYGPLAKNPFTYFTGPSRYSPRPSRLDTPRLEEFFDSLGWHSLNNAAVSMTVNGSPLEFFGVNDPHIGKDKLEVLAGALDDLRQEESDATTDRDVVTVGVVHAPYKRVLNSFVTNGADVILAGHTHGGQVCVPRYGALVTNCDLPRKQASGLSVWHHALSAAFLNVSAGLGTSIYAPVRFACKPEAVLLTFTSDDFGYS
ncbi:MAG: metallophosphatase [Homoserinimonas sp.]|jgi:predicted MPP superfamily phosphohydrolase|nr:metallophosphatase [Homoserinimonas sp.]